MSKFLKKLISTVSPTANSSGMYSASEQLQNLSALTITSVVICSDLSGTELDDTAVSTSGGFIKLKGTGFTASTSVYINGISATVTFLSSTAIMATVIATTTGTYSLMAFNGSSVGTIWAAGISSSGFPSFTTGIYSNVSNVVSTQLVATGDATLVYSLQSGSTLPTGVTLSSSGLLSGTATGVITNTVFTFTVLVNDAQYQTTQQAITLTLVISDPYFKNTVLVLHGDATPFTADASTNKFQISAVGTPSANVNNPLQPGYYSGNFDGSGYYLSVPTNAVFNFGAGAYTVEMWIYPTIFPSVSAQLNMFQMGTHAGGGNFLEFGLYNDAGSVKLTYQLYNTSYKIVVQTQVLPSTNKWYHIAMIFTGSTAYTSLDGILSTGVAYSGSDAPTGQTVYIGAWNASVPYFTGYMSNLRVVKGVAVYTGAFTPPTAPLAATQSAGTNIAAITGTSTSLLALQSNRFIDNSSTPNTITAYGTTSISVAQPFTLPSPYTGYGAGLFNGSSDYLTIPNNAAFAPAALDFTIEAWVYINALTAGSQTIFGQADSAGTAGSGIYFYACNSTGYPSVIIPYGGANYAVTSPTVIAIKQWNHIAVSRYGAIITLYVNGVASGTTNFASLALTTSSQINGIGKNGAGNFEYLNGYIYNLRFVKGTAVYTGAFTPPTAPLAATQSSGTNIAAITGTATSLLTLQNNQAQNNNQFKDSGINNFAITRTGTVTQGTFTPFSQTGWSGYFNGSSHLVGPTGNATLNTALDILGGDFTIEFWYNPTTTNADVAILTNFTASGVNGWVIGTRLGGFNINTWTSNTSAEKLSTSVGINAGIWCHVALVKLSGNLYFYVNGTEIGMYSGYTRTATANPGAGTGLGIGAYIQNLSYPSYISGYLSNIRVVKGVAVYTGNFTPPTAPLTATQAAGTNIAAITGTATSLLTLQDNRFKDNSTNNFTITAAGTPSVQAFSPFAPTTIYSASAVGGSMYFNGSSYLSAPSNSAFGVGTGDFTIEAWIYPFSWPAAGNYSAIIQISGTSIWFGLNSAGFGLRQGNVGNIISYATNPTINAWTHVAVARVGTACTLYYNGVSVATATSSASFATGTAFIACDETPGNYFTGYISNSRLIKGTAVYTGAFTPPTAPLTAIAGTSLLLNAANAGIIDATGKNDLITVGDARVSTSVTKYGSGAMYFDGTGDWLSINAPTNLLNFGTGDFTIECWVYLNAVPSGYPPIITNDNGFYINFRGSGTIALTDISTEYATSPSALTAGSWFHVAIVRSSGSSRIYVNGTGGTAVACSVNWTATTITYIGGSPSYPAINGYIDDLRVTKFARYTANFTPATYAFQDQ